MQDASRYLKECLIFLKILFVCEHAFIITCAVIIENSFMCMNVHIYTYNV